MMVFMRKPALIDNLIFNFKICHHHRDIIELNYSQQVIVEISQPGHQ